MTRKKGDRVVDSHALVSALPRGDVVIGLAVGPRHAHEINSRQKRRRDWLHPPLRGFLEGASKEHESIRTSNLLLSSHEDRKAEGVVRRSRADTCWEVKGQGL